MPWSQSFSDLALQPTAMFAFHRQARSIIWNRILRGRGRVPPWAQKKKTPCHCQWRIHTSAFLDHSTSDTTTTVSLGSKLSPPFSPCHSDLSTSGNTLQVSTSFSSLPIYKTEITSADLVKSATSATIDEGCICRSRRQQRGRRRKFHSPRRLKHLVALAPSVCQESELGRLPSWTERQKEDR